jgi:antirestriction protein ArdC
MKKGLQELEFVTVDPALNEAIAWMKTELLAFDLEAPQEWDFSPGFVTTAEPKQHRFCLDSEDFIRDTGARIVHTERIAAHYSTLKDEILVSIPGRYQLIEEYYITVFHELVHWSGRGGRLTRKSAINYASHKWEEELIAEIGAMILAHRFQVVHDVVHARQLRVVRWMLQRLHREYESLGIRPEHRYSLRYIFKQAAEAAGYLVNRAENLNLNQCFARSAQIS